MKASEMLFYFIGISANILKWVLPIWTGVSLYRYSEKAFWGLFFFFLGIAIITDLYYVIKDIIRKNSNKRS